MGAVILTNSEGKVGIQKSVEVLLNKGSALAAVEAGRRLVEADVTVKSVGFGGAPTLLGEMVCDASIMCGATLRTGAVGALKNYLHAISVARKIMERTPHVMLVGEGSELFASEIGEAKCNLLSDEARTDYEHWLQNHLPPDILARWPNVPLAPILTHPVNSKMVKGTTLFLVKTRDGNLAGGVSTSGMAYKYPGRVCDSAIIGAGLYVDNRYGAAACTHTGEMTIRAGTSRAIVAYIKKGATVQEACYEALDDLRALKGGLCGPVVIHAMDVAGTPFVVSRDLEKGAPYWFWAEGMAMAEFRRSAIEMI